MNYDCSSRVPEFSLLDSGLPFLAAEAAVDIDNYMQGRSQEDKSVKHLSQLLDSISQGQDPEVKLMGICSLLSSAISGREKFAEYWYGRPIDEVPLETREIAKRLSDFKNRDKAEQKNLSDFCVRLSNEMADHYTQYYSRL